MFKITYLKRQLQYRQRILHYILQISSRTIFKYICLPYIEAIGSQRCIMNSGRINGIMPTQNRKQIISVCFKEKYNTSLTCCHFYLFKGLWDSPKGGPPPAARETVHIVATKLESTAQCVTVLVPTITGPPKMSKSSVIRERHSTLKNKRRDSGRKKGAYKLRKLPTSLAAFMD